MVGSPVQFEQRPLLVVMGVSGCGKTSVGVGLAQRLELPYLEADDYHPASNVDKMSRGIPLTDDDRWPWLQALSQAMANAADQSGGVVATCSALKRKYRDKILQQVDRPLLFIFLDGDRDTLFARMQQRSDHYMPPSLLDSQLADLERPDADEPVATFSVDQSVDELVNEIVTRLNSVEKN